MSNLRILAIRALLCQLHRLNRAYDETKEELAALEENIHKVLPYLICQRSRYTF